MTTVRVWFTKTGEAAYISLLDLQRVMQRALKRSHLPVWYTLGFNPHIYMTFAAPLALGQESLTESLDFKTEDSALDWVGARDALNGCLPRGIEVTKVEPAGVDAGEITASVYELQVNGTAAGRAQRAFDAYNQCAQAPVVKQGKHGRQKTVDLKEYLPHIDYTAHDGALTARIVLPAGSTFTLNPALLMHFLAQEYGFDSVAVRILRTALLIKNGEKFG